MAVTSSASPHPHEEAGVFLWTQPLLPRRVPCRTRPSPHGPTPRDGRTRRRWVRWRRPHRITERGTTVGGVWHSQICLWRLNSFICVQFCSCSCSFKSSCVLVCWDLFEFLFVHIYMVVHECFSCAVVVTPLWVVVCSQFSPPSSTTTAQPCASRPWARHQKKKKKLS